MLVFWERTEEESKGRKVTKKLSVFFDSDFNTVITELLWVPLLFLTILPFRKKLHIFTSIN